MVSGKRILLGVTGSIAAYKAVDLLRKLQERGADVRVAMTKNASRFVAPITFEALTRRPVLIDEWEDRERAGIAHISYTDDIDLCLVAPATANIIGKVASGIADDTLTSAIMARECPLVMAPAMNDRMYRNPVLQRNILTLKSHGVRIIEPEAGPLACGSIGQGRLADGELIVQEVSSLFIPKDLAGQKVLVTAGPTREYIDPVRFISNPSTGKMGYAIAAAARDRGATVLLITGPTALAPLHGVTTMPVSSAEEMRQAVLEQVENSQVVIMAAAVSDFKPTVSAERKIKKEEAHTTLHLERTGDILMELGNRVGKRLLVGFAAETDDVIQNARKKLERKNMDMIVVNDVLKQGAGFGADTNAVTLIDRQGRVIDLPLMPKSEIASRIIDAIVQLTLK